MEEVTISVEIREALRYLDTVDAGNIFRRRASVMRSPPKILWGALRSALRVALHEIVNGAERREEGIQCRGWKLFLLMPRMLLFRNPRGSKIPTQRLIARFAAFSRGERDKLLIESESCDVAASRGFQRRRRTRSDTLERRADRAQSLIMMGDVSAGPHALKGAPIGTGYTTHVGSVARPCATTNNGRDAVCTGR